MKATLLMSSISRANGGISESMRRLGQSLALRPGLEVAVLGLRDAHSEADAPLWHPLVTRCLPVIGPAALGYAPGLAVALRETRADVTHVSGLWMYPSAAHARWARRGRTPYLVAPHGMLDAWALKNSAWKKRLAGLAFERAHLRGAACLHALCAAERDAIRAYGLRNPVCIIPNGMDAPAAVDPDAKPAWLGQFPPGKQVLLFLGRLHPKKGLLPLVAAWSRLNLPDWQLVIAGWDQGGHLADLRRAAAERGAGRTITFCGPLHGHDKAVAYAAASAFILPSFSEGLPMTVLEAWSYGLPVLMTPACNLPEGFSCGGALEIATDADTLAMRLEEFTQLSPAKRAAMGQQGRRLVESRFAWGRIAGDIEAVFRWVSGRGDKPACVSS